MSPCVTSCVRALHIKLSLLGLLSGLLASNSSSSKCKLEHLKHFCLLRSAKRPVLPLGRLPPTSLIEQGVRKAAVSVAPHRMGLVLTSLQGFVSRMWASVTSRPRPHLAGYINPRLRTCLGASSSGWSNRCHYAHVPSGFDLTMKDCQSESLLVQLSSSSRLNCFEHQKVAEGQEFEGPC